MPIQIFVRNLENTTITVEIPDNEITVAQLRQAIAAKTGIDAAAVDLAFGGKLLDDKVKLCDYNIQKSNTVQLVARLKGGL